jgi:hypothetical protein
MKNWKTTSLGVLGLVGIIVQAATEFLNTGQVSNIEAIITQGILSWGLIAAKDATARL